MNFVTVKNGPIDLNVAVAGRGPLILCVHGWPELWYSWRHQMAYFSELGYTVAALDVRGAPPRPALEPDRRARKHHCGERKRSLPRYSRLR